ncbi:MAG: putative lipid II flippase FtsW [bacterium]|nr:putative lipid II flippase FtsW [bacterium]
MSLDRTVGSPGRFRGTERRGRKSLEKGDRLLLGLYLGLTFFGLIILISATGPIGYQQFGDSLSFFKHQILLGIIPGFILFAIMSRISVERLKSLAFPALCISVILLVLVYLPGIGQSVGGSSRWVQFGPIRFQPSEFVKLTFLVYVAAWLSSRSIEDRRSTERGLIPFLSVLGVVLLLLILQPNTGSTAVIAGASLIMYFLADAPALWIGGVIASGFAMIAILIKLTPYRAARFLTFLNPDADPQGIGYHMNQAFLAVGSGGLFGLGYGQSRQKFLYLPEVPGDSIFAVMAEELGFFISVLVILVLGAFAFRCLQISRKTPDFFSSLLVAGIASWIGIQTFLNVGSMIGLVPMTGVTLPFISYGSSAFVAISIATGIVYSVSRNS